MSPRYTRVAIALHWLIAAFLLLQFALGWGMQLIAKQPAGPRADAYNLHKSFGLLLLGLMIARIAWRLGHEPPALPPMPRWQGLAARADHLLLYVLVVALPLSGYLGSAFSGYPVRFFGMPLPSWAGRHEALKEAMSTVHLVCSWALACVVAVHLAAVAKHVLIDRDELLGRMKPGP